MNTKMQIQQINNIQNIQDKISYIKNSLEGKMIKSGSSGHVGTFGDVYIYQNNPNDDNKIGDKDKFILKESKNQKDFLDNKNQIQIYNYLRYNNINSNFYPVIYFHHVNELEKKTYIAMEYLNIDDGWQSLKYFFDNSLYDQNKLDVLWYNFMEILRNLHENNVIHNDIKCENVMVNYNTNEVKLLDFGLSFLVNDESLSTNNDLRRIISNLLNKGTPYYMLPLKELINLTCIDTNCKEYLKQFAIKKDIFAFTMCFFFRHQKKYGKNWFLHKIYVFAKELEKLFPIFELQDIFQCFYKYLLNYHLLNYPFSEAEAEIYKAIDKLIKESEINNQPVLSIVENLRFQEQIIFFKEELKFFSLQ